MSSCKSILGNNAIRLMLMTILAGALLLGCKSKRPETDAYGNFESIEVLVSSEIQGKIIDFSIQEGQQINKDQIVGYLDSVSLYYKKQQLIAQVQAAEARLFQVSDQISVQEEQMDVLDSEIKRLESLVEEDAAPTKQLDDLKNQKRILRRQIRATERQKGTISSEIRSLLYQVAQVQDQLQKCAIKNPIDGTVLEKYAEVGELAIPGKPLYKIADLSVLKLKAYVSGKQLSQIKLGQKVKVYVDDLKEKERSYSGTITWIASEAEFTPKIIQTKEERVNLVYAVKIDVKNDGYLKIGMPAEVVFLKD
ncbi:MAG: HlyD family efflux transporter periplasmic adaptor subunit [Bacteroidales bacterium]|nr:efflux RND transporter periplasmic adaptor subunit [Bacteroidales bacterium]HOK98938.1 efflux RND transporter periplasmic adaptor subunit [Bacteroidales bacterium]HPO65117.1 efflux RND transporter periplasmic adaptor subunit [Bacteroidales bacterium]